MDRRNHGHSAVRYRASRYRRLLSSGELVFDDAYDAFPTDVGYTLGILPFSKLQMEVGLDYMGAGNFPLLGNTKLAVIEDAFFKGQPALAVGLFNVGVKTDVTDADIRYVNIGKTLPIIGRLFVGGYEGNKTITGNDGVNKGITLAWDRSFLPTKSAGGVDYTRITVCADLATGNNAYGGGGPGVSYNFNENIMCARRANLLQRPGYQRQVENNNPARRQL
jgi:hypothetical protein